MTDITEATPLERTKFLQQWWGNETPTEPLINDIEVVKGCYNQIKDEVGEIQRDVIEGYYEGVYQQDLLKHARDVIVDIFEFTNQFAVRIGVDELIQGDAVKIFKNNMTKVCKTEEDADKTVAMYTDKGVECTKQFIEQFGHWVVKDVDNKVLKPWNFKSVEL